MEAKGKHTPDHEIVMLLHCTGGVYVKVKLDAVARKVEERKYAVIDSKPRRGTIAIAREKKEAN